MRFSAVIFGVLFLPVLGLAQGLPLPNTFVKAQIAADVSALTADRPFLVAVTLAPLPEWHIYWSNPGDAGIATSFKWKVPDGFRVEPLPLPLPTAFPQPGDMTVYGYSGKTTFLFRIVPAPNQGKFVASPATFSVTADYLVCNKDRCEPGQAKLDIELYDGGATGHVFAPVDKAPFALARENLPATEPPKDVTISALPANVDEPGRATFTLELAFKSYPLTVEAFPDADDGIAVTKVKVEQSKDHAKVVLTAHRMPGQKVQPVYLPLLVVYTVPDPDHRGQTLRRGFFVPVDLRTIAGAPDTGK